MLTILLGYALALIFMFVTLAPIFGAILCISIFLQTLFGRVPNKILFKRNLPSIGIEDEILL